MYCFVTLVQKFAVDFFLVHYHFLSVSYVKDLHRLVCTIFVFEFLACFQRVCFWLEISDIAFKMNVSNSRKASSQFLLLDHLL